MGSLRGVVCCFAALVALPLVLATFARIGELTLNSGENGLNSCVMDEPNGFVYFGTRDTSPGIIVKIALATFTNVAGLTLNSGENELYSAVIDSANGFAYFGTSTSPGIVVKINLATFTRVAGLTLNSGGLDAEFWREQPGVRHNRYGQWFRLFRHGVGFTGHHHQDRPCDVYKRRQSDAEQR